MYVCVYVCMCMYVCVCSECICVCVHVHVCMHEQLVHVPCTDRRQCLGSHGEGCRYLVGTCKEQSCYGHTRMHPSLAQ